MDFLKDLNKNLAKMDGVSTDSSPPRYWSGSGNHALNRIVSGSFHNAVPQGRIVAICGPSSAGKSFIAANVAKKAQAEDNFVFVVDSEKALDDQFMNNIGVDTTKGGDDPKYLYASVVTITHCTNVVSKFIKGYKAEFGSDPNARKVVIVIDSLDQLMTDSELEKYGRGETAADQGQHPKQIKSMLKAFANDIAGTNISMVVTKQVYKGGQDHVLRGEGIWVVNDAIRYACSIIMIVTRLKLKDDSTKDVTGVRMKVEGFKTRFTRPFQTVTIEVPYDTGMNEYSGLLEIAISLGVVKDARGWYTIDGIDKKMRERELEEHYPEIIKRCEALGNKFISADLNDYEEIITNEPVKRAGAVQNDIGANEDA